MNLRDTILQEATNVIDSISEYSRLRVDERLTKSTKHSGDVLVICGGRNGNGEWGNTDKKGIDGGLCQVYQ